MKRARKGTTVALFISIATALILMAPVIIFAPFLASLFTNEPEVLTYGIHFIRLMIPFLSGHQFQPDLRKRIKGCRKLRHPYGHYDGKLYRLPPDLFFTLFQNTSIILPLTALGYPLGWVLCSILLIIYYWK